MKFHYPISGSMVDFSAGTLTKDALLLPVSLAAEPNRKITVNGIPALPEDGEYRAVIPLYGERNVLTATDTVSGEQVSSVVFRLKRANRPMYRLSLDDNIWFLQDIAKNRYASLFDNPYLALMKELHETYGVCIHINLYYCCPEHGGFNLAQMPDTYRDEWQANFDWLRLSFHAFKNLPDRPYVRADYEEARNDCEMVRREIARFAGECFLTDYTTIHWCEGTRQSCRAFREQGYRTLQCGGINGMPIDYYLTDEIYENAIRRYGYYRDEAEDLNFTVASICLNSYTPAEIAALLDKGIDGKPRGYVEMVIHEQYFYPDYKDYLPDYRERIVAGIRWCVEHGYEPSFRSPVMP